MYTQFIGTWNQGGIPVGFLPNDIANMVTWLEADYLVLDSGGAEASDAENVDKWTNRANGTYDADQTTDADRPNFATSGGPGSLNAVEFVNADTEYMDFGNNAAPFIPNSGNFHIFFGMAVDSTDQMVCWTQGLNTTASGGGRVWFLARIIGGNLRVRFSIDGDGTRANQTRQVDISGYSAGNAVFFECYRSGASFGLRTFDSAGAAGNIAADSSGHLIDQVGMVLGVENTNTTTYNGTLAQYSDISLMYFMIYQQEVTGTDLTNLRTYLSKWGHP